MDNCPRLLLEEIKWLMGAACNITRRIWYDKVFQTFITATDCRSSVCDKHTRPFCVKNNVSYLGQTFDN